MSTAVANTRCTPTVATPRGSELLPRASGGDLEAWEEIVCRYGGLVAATVRSCRPQNNDALDAVQMTWLRLTENAHRVQFPERLGTWLATTARRECLRILRDRGKLASAPLDINTVADSSVGPEQHVIDMDTAQMLRDLVAELTPRKRNLLQALYTDNPRPYAEIARAIGIPVGSIGPTRARARPYGNSDGWATNMDSERRLDFNVERRKNDSASTPRKRQ